METENLFQKVLLEPVHQGANQLFVVSGFATAAMAFFHLQELKQIVPSVQVKLIVGMAGTLGVSRANHEAFQTLMDDPANNFECSYFSRIPSVHSKVYVWSDGDNLIQGWCGSANYTQTAFRGFQHEAMTECNAEPAFNYFGGLIPESIFCNHLEADQFVNETPQYAQAIQNQIRIQEDEHGIPDELLGLESVTISLLDNSGNLPDRSGLNWGQRPEEGREPNQAYIHVPSRVYRTNFFPPVGTHFTVLTDDDRVLVCTRAQQNGKAIHTPHNNSLIGEYFRNRLGLANGALVTAADLRRYGSTEVRFFKVDDETFFMQFSPQHGG